MSDATEVRWWGGERFAIVPRSCVAAIVETAAHAPNVSAPTAVAVFTLLAMEASRDGAAPAGVAAAVAEALDMSAAGVRRVISAVLQPAGVAEREGHRLTLRTPETRHSARDGGPKRAAQRVETRRSARPSYTEGTDNEPPRALSLLPTPAVPEVSVQERRLLFAEWWAIYPRKDAKKEAEELFYKALARHGREPLFAGAQRYRDDPNREARFTMQPTKWLRNERWNDDPLPSRGSAAASGNAGAGGTDWLTRVALSGDGSQGGGANRTLNRGEP